jgi:hypothetical protein
LFVQGLPVYKKRGFVVKGWCEIKGDHFDGGTLSWPGMEREPMEIVAEMSSV